MSRKTIIDYFHDFSLGTLHRGNLEELLPLPVLVMNPSDFVQQHTGALTTRVVNPEEVMVYQPSVSSRAAAERGLRVGRAADAELAIGDPDVSRYHAVIRLDRGSWTITDMGSRNGTWIFDFDYQRSHEVPLNPRSIALSSSAYVKLGKSWYNFLTPERFFAQLRRSAQAYMSKAG